MNELELAFYVVTVLAVGCAIVGIAIDYIANVPLPPKEEPAPALPDGWQYVPGGICPVPSSVRVEVAMARIKQTLTGKAGDLNWNWTNHNDDIIAYRVVDPLELEIALLVEERNIKHQEGGFMWCESSSAQSLTKRINELEAMLK